MKKICVILSVAILLLPAFASADCVDLGKFTSWILESSRTIVFYEEQKLLARVQIPNCEIRPLSTIRLINSYVCDSDKVLIDGIACQTVSVQILY